MQTMSSAHPQDRAFRWLILGLVAAVPIGLIVSGLYPVTSRRIWVTLMESIRVGSLWLINDVIGALPPLVFLLVVMSILGIIALGFFMALVNGIRSIFA